MVCHCSFHSSGSWVVRATDAYSREPRMPRGRPALPSSWNWRTDIVAVQSIQSEEPVGKPLPVSALCALLRWLPVPILAAEFQFPGQCLRLLLYSRLSLSECLLVELRSLQILKLLSDTRLAEV